MAASFGGFGRNRVVSAELSSQRTGGAVFSYPDPQVHTTTGFDLFRSALSTGSSSITVLGHAFADSDSSPRILTAFSSSQVSLWKSGTAVVCKLSAIIHRVTAVVVSLPLSQSHSISTNFTIGVEVSSLKMTAVPLPATGATLISVYGSGFGLVNAALGVVFSGSAAGAAAWTSDTSMNCKAIASTRPAKFSLVLATDNTTLSVWGGVVSYSPPLTTLLGSMNVPCTGAAIVSLLGRNFGSYHESMVVSLIFNSAFLASFWSSDSSLSCKAPAGFGGAYSAISVTVSRAHSTAMSMYISYDTPAVNRDVCFRCPNIDSSCAIRGNSSCSTTELILESNASNFGSHQPLVVKVQTGMSPLVNAPCKKREQR
jgi:hypothetical protein